MALPISHFYFHYNLRFVAVPSTGFTTEPLPSQHWLCSGLQPEVQNPIRAELGFFPQQSRETLPFWENGTGRKEAWQNGWHGYDNELRDMRGFFVAYGPGRSTLGMRALSGLLQKQYHFDAMVISYGCRAEVVPERAKRPPPPAWSLPTHVSYFCLGYHNMWDIVCPHPEIFFVPPPPLHPQFLFLVQTLMLTFFMHLQPFRLG